MKIAVPVNGPTLNAKVSQRFGTSEYLLIVDLDTGELEAVPNPVKVGQHGAGIYAVVLVISKGAWAVLTGYCSPAICKQMRANDIEVITGINGVVREAVEKYRKSALNRVQAYDKQRSTRAATISKDAVVHAIRSSVRQFITLLPVLVGVVLLIGLFNAFVSKEMLKPVFSGNILLDTLWGACFGSILAGNPITSYVIGGELLNYGVSLLVVTAFIVTWVAVGLVQLPAEIAALGRKFALLRNGLSFIFSIPIAILTVVLLNFVQRWSS
jgi:predicted Fe-Mo cluster-binding NifX family protein